MKKSPKNLGFQRFPLNTEQKSAAEAPRIPQLIVAGAGTGKTRTLTSRISYLIEQGTAPERICAITFTNKAAKEMLSRVSKQLSGGSQPLISTFHSFGARILRKECRAFGRQPNFAIFDDHDSFELIKKIVKGGILFGKSDKRDTPAFFANAFGRIKNIGSDEALKGETESRKEKIMDAFEKYEAALVANNAFDFDDLIVKPVELLRRGGETLGKYQNMFDAILVDEFQDVSPIQNGLVKLLAGKHRNLSVVGDDEQTIYSWRYANIRTFLDFEKEWPGAQIYFLEENYRSSGNIIRAASTVAANNRFRTPKKLRTGKDDGEKIILYEAWGEGDEAAWIGSKIMGFGEAAFGKTAILYRTNAQSRALEQALIRRGIPYQIFGGLKFYERREVKDAVAAARWAANARDEVAHDRLTKLSKRKSAEFARRISDLRNESRYDARDDSNDGRDSGLSRDNDDSNGSDGGEAGLTPTAVIKIFLESFGYFDYLKNNFINADERQENISELLSFASEAADLPDFLEKIALLQATDDNEAQGKGRERRKNDGKDGSEKVSMMTIHLAKGLEFKNVFIAGACEGILPHIRSIENEEQLEEERRLMYVAMTRAEEKLFISFYGMPSRFISELPEDCVEVDGDTMRDLRKEGENGYGEGNYGDEDDGENVIDW